MIVQAKISKFLLYHGSLSFFFLLSFQFMVVNNTVHTNFYFQCVVLRPDSWSNNIVGQESAFLRSIFYLIKAKCTSLHVTSQNYIKNFYVPKSMCFSVRDDPSYQATMLFGPKYLNTGCNLVKYPFLKIL